MGMWQSTGCPSHQPVIEKRLPEEMAQLRQEEQLNREKGKGIPDKPLQLKRPQGSPE